MRERLFWPVIYLVMTMLSCIGYITSHDRLFTIMTTVLLVGSSIRDAILDGKD